jgi:hypothetical protein
MFRQYLIFATNPLNCNYLGAWLATAPGTLQRRNRLPVLSLLIGGFVAKAGQLVPASIAAKQSNCYLKR